MKPENIVMFAVDEVKALDYTLITMQKPEVYLDKILRAIYIRLRNRSEAMTLLEDYLDHLRMEEYIFEEFLIPRVQDLYEALYHQLLDIKVYLSDGKLPYVYGGRDSTRLVFLSLCEE